MELQIDAAGRIVLPKQMRDRLGLTAGSQLELTECDGGLLLRPSNARSKLLKRNGRWVYTGHAPRDINWERLVEQDRELRDKEIYER